ncbi:aminotransferase class V-fold PLP-dependent enzyme [Halobacteriovorax sp. RZ-1]|uniref:cysteine desulfurase family protein n=1 Tax=unclassified Halobacteriovorax TaxID=2639665 RepID=UPI00371DFC32
MYYFDHAASTKLYPEVIEVLSKSFELDYPNPAAKHLAGKECAKKIEGARANILKFIDAKNYGLIFTSSATEANNQIIRSIEEGIIFLSGDHPSVTKVIDNGEGFKSIEEIVDAVTSETQLVCISLVNSQSGQYFEVEKIAQAVKAKNRKCLVHVDATQGFGKVPFTLKDSEIDFVTFGAHKMGGPRGIGGLIFKESKVHFLKRYLRGGAHEKGLRASTPSTSLVLALAKACELAFTDLDDSFEKAKTLKEEIKAGLSGLHKNISYPFEDQNTSPFILCVLFEGIASDIIMRHLETKGIMISSSTACSSKIKGLNPLFAGLGIDEKFHKNILRISIGKSTTQEEVLGMLQGFSEVIEEIGFLIK